MNARLEVQSHGFGKLRVVGAGLGSKEAQALNKWLERRDDVVQFEQRKNTGIFLINFDDEKALPGHFIRNLRDKLYNLTCKEEKIPFEIKPVRSLNGRVRFKILGLDGHQMEGITAFASVLPGVLPISATLCPNLFSSVLLGTPVPWRLVWQN